MTYLAERPRLYHDESVQRHGSPSRALSSSTGGSRRRSPRSSEPSIGEQRLCLSLRYELVALRYPLVRIGVSALHWRSSIYRVQERDDFVVPDIPSWPITTRISPCHATSPCRGGRSTSFRDAFLAEGTECVVVTGVAEQYRLQCRRLGVPPCYRPTDSASLRQCHEQLWSPRRRAPEQGAQLCGSLLMHRAPLRGAPRAFLSWDRHLQRLHSSCSGR